MNLNRSYYVVIPLIVVMTELTFLVGSSLANPQAINEVITSYNTVTLTHRFEHQDDVPVTCNGQEEQPLRYNVLTGDHNTTIFRPEGTVCNLQIDDPADSNSGGLNLGSTLIAETKVTPNRPARGTRYFVSPDGNGVSQALLSPGSLEETLTSNLTDAEIFFFPGVYKNTGEIRANNLTGVSLIGNGAIIDGSGRRLGEAAANSWVPIGNGVWENTNPDVVDPNYLMMLFDDNGFGTGMVVQHAGTSEDRQDAFGIDYDVYWSTSPDKTTWWMRLQNNESPAEHEMVRFSKEYGMQFFNGTDIWLENLQIQNYGKVTAKGAPLFPNRNRILEFQNCSEIVIRNVDTRHSTKQAVFFLSCHEVLLEDCATEYRRFLTHNRDTLKTAGPPSNLTRYGWEHASSVIYFDCENVVARNCSIYGVTDWCHLFDCKNVDLYYNRFRKVVGESLASNGDCRNIRYWINRVYSIEEQGPFAAQSSTGPIWYVNNASIDGGGWTPNDDLSGLVPAGEDLPNPFEFLGWPGTSSKFNTLDLPLIGQIFFFNNTAIIAHAFEERYIWDARQSAFSFGREEQVHSDSRSRNNVWASSGIGFIGGNPLDNLDFEHDQIWAGNLQKLGWKYLYPHVLYVDEPSDSRHSTFDAFKSASGTYTNGGVEQEPILDSFSGNPFNVINRVEGEALPGITGNSVFESPKAMTGAFLEGS